MANPQSYGDVPTPRYSRRDVVGRRVADEFQHAKSCFVQPVRAVEAPNSREHAEGVGAEARQRIWVDRAGQRVGKNEV